MAKSNDVPDSDEVRRRFDDWKRQIGKPYIMAFWLLRRKVRLPFEHAWDCLNTALVSLLKQWQKDGPPDRVENWASYLATAAYNVYLRRPTRDARLLVFKAALEDLLSLSKDQDPAEIAAIRDEFANALGVLMDLPRPKAAGAVLLWALGGTFAEIATALNTTVVNARALKHLGIRDLQKRMVFRNAI